MLHAIGKTALGGAESKALIYEQIRKNFLEATQEKLDAALGWPQ